MAKKPDITTIATGYYSRQALNDNFENLKSGFDNTLSLDGSTPNAMGADLDMNGNVITNASAIYVGGSDIVTTTATALAAATVAQADAEAAVVSATASAATATTGASTATTKASEASASASAASASETNAATSESNAATSASSASTSATTATAAASTATTKASEASTSATNASNSATSSSISASAAQTAQTAAEAAFDSFDNIYLGPKASEPTLDNDGGALVAGSLYYNTTLDKLYVYSGSVWQVTAGAAAGDLQSTNNLSDLTSAATARTNLGLGTAATTASTDYATAAQGTLADSAVQPNDSPTFVDGTFTGTITADGITSGDATFNTSGTDGFNISSVNPAIKLTDTDTSESSRLWHSGTSVYLDNLGTGSTVFRNGSNVRRGSFKPSGDFELRDSTGTTEKFYWDASSSSLGLGTTTPTLATLDIVGTGATKPTIHVTSGETYFNGNSVVPKVPTDGLINIENGELKIWPDITGDGDYDADMWARDNLYLAAESRIHLRTKIVEGVGAGTDEGRLVIGADDSTNYIQSAKNYSGTVLKDLAIGEYNSSNWWMYFDQSAGGWVGINTITPASALDVNGTITATGLDVNGSTKFGNPPDALPSNNSSGNGAVMSSSGKLSMLGDSDWSLGIGRHTTTGQVVYFYYNGSVEGNISVTASGTTYNTTSDYRLKENVTPIQGAADVVMAMQPCTYTAKADGLWYDGFLAHELQEVHPRAVTGTKDEVDEDGNPVMQSVDYSKLTPILTAALQEALTEIAALKIRVAALEG